VARVTEAIPIPREKSPGNLINGFAATTLRETVMTLIRTALLGATLAAALLATASAGFAQGTPEQRSACMGDAFKFCSSEIPNIPRITACMKANFSKLSPACRAAASK
jgi:hypothetical protein